MGLIKCVVPGCDDRSSPRHRIPVLDQELYEAWLKRIGSKELSESDPKFVGRNKRICSVHFSPHCRIPNSTKLKNRSLPTIRLPGFKEEPCEENSILKYPYREITIARAELLRYIKDFKPEPEDLLEDQSKVPDAPRDPLASGQPGFKDELRDTKETNPSEDNDSSVSTPPCNRLLAQAIESLDKEIKPPVFTDPVPKVLDHDDKSLLAPAVAVDFQFGENGSELISDLPSNKPQPEVDQGLLPSAGAFASSDDDTEAITEPMNIDFTYLLKMTSQPDSPLIKEEPPVNVEPAKSPPIKKPVEQPSPQIAVVEEPSFDATNIEPMNIDFTYLMKITSLPDAPLLKDDSPTKAVSFQQPITISFSDSSVDFSSALSSCTAPEDLILPEPNPNIQIASAFDLEELIHERCKSLLAEGSSSNFF